MGKSLWDIKKKSLSIVCVAQIGIQLVEALKELHEAGFVHADIKPDNFLIQSKQVENRSSVLLNAD